LVLTAATSGGSYRFKIVQTAMFGGNGLLGNHER
jgi:hypothetical protein